MNNERAENERMKKPGAIFRDSLLAVIIDLQK